MQILTKVSFATPCTISGDIRNDVYVTMERGEFEKGKTNIV